MKHIALIALGEKTSYFCRDQLHRLLGNRINISNYYAEGNLPQRIKADFAIFTSRLAYQKTHTHLSDGLPYMISRRSINYHEVDKLFELPAGTNVLLVNDCIQSANDTISLLQTLGIDHLNYYAYAPGMDDPKMAKVAVTPGESRFVPPSIEKIVDIKTRLLDITSLVEMLSRIGLLTYYADFLSAQYVRDIIQLIDKNQRYKNRAAQLEQELCRLEASRSQKTSDVNLQAVYHFDDIIGSAPALQSAIHIAKRFADSDSTVLIQAQSGTGKELMAQSIHNASERADGPFVAVNFAAITETLLDSELFGYVEGAFTGASRHGAIGLFEQANHGTIFLDEIGDASLSFQVKLLRVLQEREIRRVGSTVPIHIDVRIIAATNQDLKVLIRQGRFREDLYYRLNVLPLTLPPLAERKEDIPVLVAAFLKSFFLDMGASEMRDWIKEILPVFHQYSWPGNIRELQNVVEYLANVCDGRPRPDDLPSSFTATIASMRNRQGGETAGENLKKAVLQELAIAARIGKHLGRRSLARNLDVPESQIRHICQDLVKEGEITLKSGRGGIQLRRNWSEILDSRGDIARNQPLL
ncbi:sigma-54 interaction domain-containing protein [Mitsuokella jalaludinii]|uniref:Transcriptional regulatory protein ZraR n=2 Tax=Mitsuokella jalaludinii TaxID=187979 RepID=A0A174AMQ4_9FIRM|nr:sigma 54-interacting transcriptional regulator [Mitsuokella jalaludinii]MCQ1533603.1 sigma 54-interacting transcriptional regulator [Mitsuokella jalaludinii]CUN89493.1 Transcriptional regulatory protein ZraR [Mitsuokella jalaludinii]